MTLDEFGDAQKPLPHVGREFVEFSLDATVEDLHTPGHMPEAISKMRWAPSVTDRAVGSPEGGRHPLRLASVAIHLRRAGGCPPRSRRGETTWEQSQLGSLVAISTV
jgi:hypothetical protein